MANGRFSRRSSAPAVAVCLAVVAAGAWRWQTSVFQSRHSDQHLHADAWEPVKTQYPMPPDPTPTPALSTELVDTVVSAHPFSPQRRAAGLPGAPAEGGSGGGAVEPASPKFVYKGRINVGSRQRAILEDTAGRKTYFLEVGQAVAGFKVLDIAENQVVLSDPQVQQELIVPLASKSGP